MKEPFRWHLAQTPRRTWCGQIARPTLTHYDPLPFLAEPKARRCVKCESAYSRTYPFTYAEQLSTLTQMHHPLDAPGT